MKILRKEVLASWVLSWVLAAAIGMFGGVKGGSATVSASGAGGFSASDTGWG